MAKEAPLEALSPEQITATVADSIMQQFAAAAAQEAAELASKVRKRQAAKPAKPAAAERSPRHAIFLSRNYDVKLMKYVWAAVTETLGSNDQCLVLRTRNASHAKVIWAVAKELPEAVDRRQTEMLEGQIDALVDVYLPKDPLAPALAELVRDNARARADFITKIPMLTAELVADLAEHEAENRSVTASRWKKARKIFSVPHKGDELYPLFQFRDQAPHPVIRTILEALPQTMSPWQIAFWFAGANGWLEGARPMDRLDSAEAVLKAARQEGEVWVG